MFNQTNMIIGSIYAISIVTGGTIVLGILKLAQDKDRIARAAGMKASASAIEYLQSVYRKRVDRMLELIDTSDISNDTADKLRDLVDCPL